MTDPNELVVAWVKDALVYREEALRLTAAGDQVRAKLVWDKVDLCIKHSEQLAEALRNF